MTLKTLKDLIEYGGGLRYKRIKQEAIKWVKEIRKEHYGAQIPELLGENPKAKWIKHFFNITKEDLK